MFSIGEFSKITGLTVKTLRYYHEQGLLEPSRVESGSGYRFYDYSKVEVARAILALRDLEFPLAEIKEILVNYADDADLISFLEERKSVVRQRLANERRILATLNDIIHFEKEARSRMQNTAYEVEYKQVDAILVACIKMTGNYSDCGKGFSRLGRKFGRFINGKAMMFCHDEEYREHNANFEIAMPIKKGKPIEEIDVKTIPGGKCLSLMHLGPYTEINRSYEKIMRYAADNQLTYSIPTREIYHKGPGIIFRGNPKKYLTEIQLMLD